MIYCKRDENDFIHGDQLMILGCQMVSFEVMKDVEEQEGTAMTQWDDIHYTVPLTNFTICTYREGKGNGGYGSHFPFFELKLFCLSPKLI